MKWQGISELSQASASMGRTTAGRSSVCMNLPRYVREGIPTGALSEREVGSRGTLDTAGAALEMIIVKESGLECVPSMSRVPGSPKPQENREL